MYATSEDQRVEVVRAADQDRFELTVDGQLAGLIRYSERSNNTALLHTEIDEAFKGRGLAVRLIRDALEIIRSEGLGLLPYCPAIRSFIHKNPQYRELIPAEKLPDFKVG